MHEAEHSLITARNVEAPVIAILMMAIASFFIFYRKDLKEKDKAFLDTLNKMREEQQKNTEKFIDVTKKYSDDSNNFSRIIERLSKK